MNVCGCIVHTRPERAARVGQSLATLPGVEVHGGGAGGKLVVTVEDVAQAPAVDTLSAIGALEGVINTVLIYHYGGDDVE
jgi:nitrate reductase NapD